jgi:hypothetical protein
MVDLVKLSKTSLIFMGMIIYLSIFIYPRSAKAESLIPNSPAVDKTLDACLNKEAKNPICGDIREIVTNTQNMANRIIDKLGLDHNPAAVAIASATKILVDRAIKVTNPFRTRTAI